MSIDNARAALTSAQALIASALNELPPPEPLPPPPPPPPPIETWTVRAGQSIQAVLDAAPVGSIVKVEPGVYVGALKFMRPVTLQPTTLVPAGRAAADLPVKIRSAGETATLLGNDIVLRGLGLESSNPDMQIVNHAGLSTLLDRCAIMGDPVAGQHRGVAANGVGLTMRQCRVDDIFAAGRDTQAVLGWDGTKDLLIDDCYLSAAAEAVMFGGADSTAADRVPTRITIRNSTLTKNPLWFAGGFQIKNALELKSAIGVHVSDCVLEYAGISAGQGAYAIVLNVRDAGGKAPWSTIEDVLIERCHVRYAGGCVNYLGTDDSGRPSLQMKNVKIVNCAFTDINPLGITKGAGRCFLFQRAPVNVTLERITVQGANLAAQVYLVPPAPIGLVLRDVVMPPSRYGLKIDGGGAGLPALQALMPDALLELGQRGCDPEILAMGVL